MWIKLNWIEQASSPPSQHQTVDVTQLQDPHGYSQHSIQVQQIQVTEPPGPGQGSTQVNPHTSSYWFKTQQTKNTLMTISSLSVLRSGFKPHFPAAESGVKPLPAHTRDFSSKPQSAGQQYPAAGHCAAHIYTRKLELSGLLWVIRCT